MWPGAQSNEHCVRLRLADGGLAARTRLTHLFAICASLVFIDGHFDAPLFSSCASLSLFRPFLSYPLPPSRLSVVVAHGDSRGKSGGS
jgi:hypothetical protein